MSYKSAAPPPESPNGPHAHSSTVENPVATSDKIDTVGGGLPGPILSYESTPQMETELDHRYPPSKDNGNQKKIKG